MSRPRKHDADQPRAARPGPFPWCASCPDCCSLDCAPQRCLAEVLAVGGDAASGSLLARLGILAGAVLLVQRSAPLGGPVLVEARGSTVAVGRRLARHVLVRPLAGGKRGAAGAESR